MGCKTIFLSIIIILNNRWTNGHKCWSVYTLWHESMLYDQIKSSRLIEISLNLEWKKTKIWSRINIGLNSATIGICIQSLFLSSSDKQLGNEYWKNGMKSLRKKARSTDWELRMMERMIIILGMEIQPNKCNLTKLYIEITDYFFPIWFSFS